MIACSPCWESYPDLARAVDASVRWAVSAEMFSGAALVFGEEHVGSLAWLCRVVQASGRCSAQGRSLQLIVRKAHHRCAIISSFYAAQRLSEIWCALRVPCSVGKSSGSGSSAESAQRCESALNMRASGWPFPSWIAACHDGFHTEYTIYVIYLIRFTR